MKESTKQNRVLDAQVIDFVKNKWESSDEESLVIAFSDIVITEEDDTIQRSITKDEIVAVTRRSKWKRFIDVSALSISVLKTKNVLKVVSESAPPETLEQPDVSAPAEILIKDDYFWMPPENKYVKKGIKAGLNVLVTGPAGSGKSTMLRKILNKYEILNLNGETSIDDFIGCYELKNGDTVFNNGVLPYCMVNGVPLILDEIDAASPEVLFILQGVLEGESIRLKTGEKIKPVNGFGIFATANTIGKGDDTGQYQGTNVLNEAFLDRFGMIVKLWYMPQQQEIKVLLNRTGLPEILSTDIVKVAHLARKSMKSGTFNASFSTRKCIAWAKLFMLDVTLENAFKLTCLNKVDESDRATLCEIFQRVTNKTVK